MCIAKTKAGKDCRIKANLVDGLCHFHRKKTAVGAFTCVHIARKGQCGAPAGDSKRCKKHQLPFVVFVVEENLAIGPFKTEEEARKMASMIEKRSVVVRMVDPPLVEEVESKAEVAEVTEVEEKKEDVEMCSIYRREKSLHGHALDVLKSALQKYIRRGNVEGAMYCLGELDRFSSCEGGEKIRTNMIHRLMIIFMEDICLGGVKSWLKVDTLVSGWLRDRSKTHLIQELVLLLCAAKKTRACSYARAYSTTLPDGTGSFEEQIAAKDWSSVKTLLSRLGQKSYVKEYKQAAEEMRRAGVKHMDIALRWVAEVKTVERPLFFLLPLLEHLFGGYELEEVKLSFDSNWEEHNRKPVWEFDDYVFDKHTRKGLRGRDYFVNVSSKVNNEIFLLPKCFSDKYHGIDTPLVDDGFETDFELIARCQLVCTRSKTDTVIARSKDKSKIVFLKGPFKDSSGVEVFLKLQDEKKKRGIPAVNCSALKLIPNRWSSTPLGVRNELDLSVAHTFLLCDTLFEEKDIVTKTAGSTLWPMTEVLDCKKMDLTIDPFSLNKEQLEDYVAALKFRLEFGLGDFADRNFLLGRDGRVYSVDEESTSTVPIDLKKQLKARRYALVEKYL